MGKTKQRKPTEDTAATAPTNPKPTAKPVSAPARALSDPSIVAKVTEDIDDFSFESGGSVVDFAVKLQFRVHYHTVMGQNLHVLGSTAAMGQFAEGTTGIQMQFTSDFYWVAVVTFTASEVIDNPRFYYKYMLLDEHRNRFEEHSIRCIELEPLQRMRGIVELRDSWKPSTDQNTIFSTSAFRDAIFRWPRSPSPQLPASRDLEVQLLVAAPRVAETDSVYVYGEADALGGWNISKAVELHRFEYPLWRVVLPLDFADVPSDYKYVIGPAGGLSPMHGPTVETGFNRNIAAPRFRGASTLLQSDTDGFRYPTPWKGTGVALPVFSLRTGTSLGCGEFTDLIPTVDWLHSLGMSVMQLLPVNDTSVRQTWRDSYPYSNLSVFALHPMYIHIPAVARAVGKTVPDYETERVRLDLPQVDYEETMATKIRMLRTLWSADKDRFLASAEYEDFVQDNAFWIFGYAVFCVLRDQHGTSDYSTWNTTEPPADTIATMSNKSHPKFADTAFHIWVQYHLHVQLSASTEHAKMKHIAVKGDLPIGVDPLSVDTWMFPELFHLDMSTGAPPDYFAVKGQNWGFPTYNWEAMAADGFLWWRRRLQCLSKYFQAYRIDHILGFFRIWEIPGNCTSGLLGHFRPAIPIWHWELEREGIWDFDRLCRPYIRSHHVQAVFDHQWDSARLFLEETTPDNWQFLPALDSEKKIVAHFQQHGNYPEATKWRDGLLDLMVNVVLLRDPTNNLAFHPRIELESTSSFQALDDSTQAILKRLYVDHFYNRQELLWQQSAMSKLPALKAATDMLVCGEDLGMVPACVKGVMANLCLMTLRIQRMPEDPKQEFGHPSDYAYLNVCSPSCHDASTIRSWWEEDRARSARFHSTILGRRTACPYHAEPDICLSILQQHLFSPSALCILPLQELFALEPSLRVADPDSEQINDPSNPHHYWRYRVHVTMERLQNEQAFASLMKTWLSAANRSNVIHY